MDDFVTNLHKRESKAVTEVMAFMSYNPSIGRVLEKGGVRKFQRLVIKLVSELYNVNSAYSFDSLHHRFIMKMINNFETSLGKRLSYGQGQKPINVFLKLYVDWAGKPDGKVRRKLLPFLHVPLDYYIMEAVRWEYADWYEANIRPLIRYSAQQFSLSKMNKILRDCIFHKPI